MRIRVRFWKTAVGLVLAGLLAGAPVPASAVSGNDSAAMLAKADRLLASGSKGDALRLYKRIDKKFATSEEAPIALQKIAEIYFARKKYKKAFKSYSAYLNRFPERDDYQKVIERMFQIGNTLLADKTTFGNPKESSIKTSIEVFDDIQSKSIDHETTVSALYNSGVGNFRLKKYDDAITSLERIDLDTAVREDMLYLTSRCYYELAVTAGHNQIPIDNALIMVKRYRNRMHDPSYMRAVDNMLAEVLNLKAGFYGEIAHFYAKTHHGDAAVIYRKKIVSEFGTTPEAAKARAQLKG